MTGRRLAPAFYRRGDVEAVGCGLLGKYLCTRIEGVFTSGMIVETEAYGGGDDRASHAFGGRRTARTEVMYAAGGVAYVYLCYGIHRMFNVVTGVEGAAAAILVRALEPAEGIGTMLERRGLSRPARPLTGGPGALTSALGITLGHNRADLRGGELWIEDRGADVPPSRVERGPRVGVAYAGPDAGRPRRFWVRGNPWVSPAK